MIFKSFIVAFVSVIIFFCLLALLSYIMFPDEYDGGSFLQLLFFGGGVLIPLVFIILCLLNLSVQWGIKFSKNITQSTLYFLYSLIFAVIPILAFIVFDYAQRGRYFEEKTFLSITGEYAGYFLLGVFVIFLNRKIVWNNFRLNKPVQ